jgi:hypothetical protein
MKRDLYRLPTDTARHNQFKKLCLDYFNNHEKLLNNPSQRFATRARKALIRIKEVAHHRGIELLDLYAPSKNEGKQPINKKEKNNGRTQQEKTYG